MGYLNYIEQPQTGKTKIFNIISNGQDLGVIKWFSNWRRYCLFPKSEVLFDSSCLSEIKEKLNSLMLERKDGSTEGK